jgi:hypothetical protein
MLSLLRSPYITGPATSTRSTKYDALKGWNDSFEKRSASFWKKRMYTNVRISFKLKSSATDLHREALLTLIKKVIKNGTGFTRK